MVERHRVLGTTLAHRAQRVHITEHVCKRHERIHDLDNTTAFSALDLPTTRVEVAADVTHVVVWRDNFNLHDWLENFRASFTNGFTVACTTCDFEGEDRGVHVMVCTIDEGDLHVDHREADQRACAHDRFDTLRHARDVFLRDSAADDGVDEFETLTGFTRLDNDLDAGELTRTTRLLLVGVVFFGLAGDRLTVSHLRLTDVGFHLEFTTHTVDENVEVKFTHARNDGLAGFFVGLDAERRIFSSQAVQGEAHLFLVGLGLRLDGDVDNRIREDHALEDNLRVRRSKGITGGGVLETNDSNDVTSKCFGDLLAAVRVHLEHAANALALALHGVFQADAGFEVTRIDAAEGQRTHVRVVGDLECQHRERLVVVSMTLDRLFGLGVDALDRRNVDRRGQEVDHAIEQGLHALVLEGRA